MIFNSFEFIFLFLPIVLAVYFILGRYHIPSAKAWLLVTSLYFYAYWNPKYLPIVLVSMVMNYLVGWFLGKNYKQSTRKWILTLGIAFNIALLGYFKYFDFFITTTNSVLGTNLPLQNLLLPLAISFYTFTQIAYLVDSYRNETKELNFLNYGLFVTFFPHLIAGPIVHHSDIMPPFSEKKTYKINFDNIAKGTVIFVIGLFKKVVIADYFADYANKGYATVDTLSFVDSWITSLSYTFQLYFDFSGYSDMAIGLALLFNIRFPVNFNSPYKALDIQDFWRRWHMTLSGFLTKYLYIPLGGNRKGTILTYVNIFLVFFISGLWHGAGWTFIIWGTMHGLASIVNRLWKNAGMALPRPIAWLVTFLFVHIAWVFFRATSVAEAATMLKKMIGMEGVKFPTNWEFLSPLFNVQYVQLSLFETTTVLALIIGMFISTVIPNSTQLSDRMKTSLPVAILTAVVLFYCVMQLQQVSAFLYFNF